MRFEVDGELVHELTETQKKVICNDIHLDVIDIDLKRRVKYIIEHKYDNCMKRLKKEWIPKLAANGVQTIPVNDEEFANLVFSQPNYLDRKQRDALNVGIE